MRRSLMAGLASLAVLFALAPAQAQQENPEQAQEQLRTALAGFVQRNLAAYREKTDSLIEQLEGTGCSVGPSTGADGLPEPQTLVLSASRPGPKLPTIAGNEHIDPNSVVVHFGGTREVALDQDTSNVLGISNGVPVKVTARVFQIKGDVCELTRRVTRSNGQVVERKERHRIDRIVDARQVDIGSLLGNRLRFTGGRNLTFNNNSGRLEADGPGGMLMPELQGKGAKFEPVSGCGQRFTGDTEDIGARHIDRPVRGFGEREAVGLVKLNIGDGRRPLNNDMVTGENSLGSRLVATVTALVVGKDNQQQLRGIVRDSAHATIDRPDLFDIQIGNLVAATPSGPPGLARLSVRPAGSTAGSLVGEAELTSSRLELVSDGPRPFIDDDPTIRIKVDGPLPAGSGLAANWRVEGSGIPVDRGEDALTEGPGETTLSIPMPSAASVIDRRGIRLSVEVEIQNVENRPQLFEELEVFLRPPPVEALEVVGRRKGSSGAFEEGPFDLFRVQGAPGIEIAYRMRHRGGIQREVAPRLVPAIGVQQAGSKGLKFRAERDFPEITADLESTVTEGAIRNFLRQSAAEVSPFSPLPGVDVVKSEEMAFTVNDVLLAIENLGRNGFVWRLLVDGDADMTRYRAQYVGAEGASETRSFQADGASFVAENQFGPGDVVSHVSIIDQDGVEVARINQRSLEAVVPRVRLDVPGVYKQGVDHPLTATISILGDINPLDLACVWKLQDGFGELAFGSTFLQPIGQGFASCANSVKMDVNEATLGKFPEVEVRLIRIPTGLGQ